MQEIFPEQVQSEPRLYLERLKQPGTMPAPEGGFPQFEGYSVVSVRVREATITATNESIVDALPPDAHAQPIYSYAPPPPPPAPQPAFAETAAVAPQLTAKPRRRFAGRDLAIWICVGQLGVIIWWLVGPANQQRHDEPRGVQKAITAPSVNNFFTTAAGWPMQVWNGAKTHVAKAGAKKAPKHSKKSNGRKGGFVPPPPPELAVDKMLVPPPPVAYALPMAGAAAASTLPAPPKREHIAEPVATAAIEREDLTPNTVPAEHATTASFVPAEESSPVAETATTTAAAAPSAIPDWLQSVPSYNNWHDATKIESSAPARTVMNGHRKRIITDR